MTKGSRKVAAKGLLSILLIAIMTLAPGLATPAHTSEEPSHWAAEYVDLAIMLDLVPSNLQSRYTQPITRAEFAALAVTLYEFWHGEITGRSQFADTNDVFVQKAAYIGVVSGVGNNRFSPNTQLTREQAATMLARLATAMGQSLPSQSSAFADNSSISYWASSAVGQVQVAEIMGGVGNNMFSPQGPYTREQSITTVIRLLNFILSAIFLIE